MLLGGVPPMLARIDSRSGQTSYVGWVYCFSTPLRGVFPRVLQFSPLTENQRLTLFVFCGKLIWFPVFPISRASASVKYACNWDIIKWWLCNGSSSLAFPEMKLVWAVWLFGDKIGCSRPPHNRKFGHDFTSVVRTGTAKKCVKVQNARAGREKTIF